MPLWSKVAPSWGHMFSIDLYRENIKVVSETSRPRALDIMYVASSSEPLKPLKIVSMIRKYHNHKRQTTPCHREEEPLNHHETPGRQIKQSNQLSLPHQDDCNTRMDIK